MSVANGRNGITGPRPSSVVRASRDLRVRYAENPAPARIHAGETLRMNLAIIDWLGQWVPDGLVMAIEVSAIPELDPALARGVPQRFLSFHRTMDLTRPPVDMWEGQRALRLEGNGNLLLENIPTDNVPPGHYTVSTRAVVASLTSAPSNAQYQDFFQAGDAGNTWASENPHLEVLPAQQSNGVPGPDNSH